MSSAVSHSIQIHGSSSAEKQCIGAVSSRNPKKDVPSDKSRLPGYDYSHKWVTAPKGSAFLYARREVQHLLEPLVVSWGWEPERTNLLNLDGATSRFVLENEWQGTRDPAAYLTVPAAIQFQSEHDWPRVRQECHELLQEARRCIEALTGLPPICPDSPEWYAQIAAFPLPACDGATLQRRLYDEYRVEVPIIDWNGRQLVRVSVQRYNTAEDVEALVGALEVLLTQVRS